MCLQASWKRPITVLTEIFSLSYLIRELLGHGVMLATLKEKKIFHKEQ